VPDGCGLHHLDLNVRDLAMSEPFYRELLGYLGYRELDRGEGWVSFGTVGFYMTLVQTGEPYLYHGFHRKRIGVNHLAFPAASPAAVDKLHAWLVEREIPVLYGGPLDMSSERGLNYALFFEDPDRLKIEFAFRSRLDDAARGSDVLP
jgi:catechol 2,3-dioxygenase-like lactoylglutathione lyase family enzyme